MSTNFVVFSDFDGTITERDVIISIMAKFAPPKWKSVMRDILEEKITISEGVQKLFSLIPSNRKDEILDWVLKNIKIRKGFKEFLEFLNKRNIPFIVLSGGLDFYVYEYLKPYRELITDIYCNRAIFKKEFIEIEFIYDCNSVCKNDCGMCKGSVIAKYEAGCKIHIGDSITDLSAVKVSELIFARGDLVKRLRKMNIDFVEFENFYTVIDKFNLILNSEVFKEKCHK